MNVLKGSYLKLVNQSCTQASYRMNQQGQQVRQIEILERSSVFFFCAAWVIDLILACSRLRDSGGKSFSKKKCKTRAGAGVPPPPPRFPVASYFRLFSSPLYYLRAWHGLLSFKVSSLNAWSCYSFWFMIYKFICFTIVITRISYVSPLIFLLFTIYTSNTVIFMVDFVRPVIRGGRMSLTYM